MSESEEEDIGFEEQIELEKQEEEKKKLKKTRTDEDGTEYEWDEEKQAWFPKIDANFIAQYQMNYGETNAEGNDSGQKADTDTPFWEDPNIDPNSDEYKKKYFDYYAYYYGHEKAVEYCGYNYYADKLQEFDNDQNVDQSIGQNKLGDQKDEKGLVKDKKGQKRKREIVQPKREEGWFEVNDADNTTVYVSGLPLDITDDEFKDLMNKCGMIMFDPIEKKMKLKLYRDEFGNPKGDGRCCYIKVESVDLALKILDGYDYKGKKIKVELAKFTLKGNFDPSKRKKKLSNKEKRKLKEKQNKLFDWRPDKLPGLDGTRKKHEKVVVLKNMFDPSDFDEDPTIINELRQDVRIEAAKFGEVKNVKIFDNHPDGVMMVYFQEAEEADVFIEAQHHRWFSKRRIIAQQWDGRTKFEIQESEAQREERLKKWDNFLSKGEGKSKGDGVTSSDNSSLPVEDKNKSAEDKDNNSANTSNTSQTLVAEAENVSDSSSVEKTESSTPYT